MTNFTDLSEDMIGEILSRVPLISLSAVRSTCKTWNDRSKKQVLGEKGAKKNQFLEFMIRDHNICSLRFDLQKACNEKDDEKDSVDPSMKQISIPDNQDEVYKVYHCDGLLLCVTSDHHIRARLLVWNPYMGQTRWIRHIKKIDRRDVYALGYGYDNNNNRKHKILRTFYDYPNHKECAEVVKCTILALIHGGLLMSIPSPSERFGPRLPLPFQPYRRYSFAYEHLFWVRDEKLAVLSFLYEHDPQVGFELERSDIIEMWISTKTEPNAISWSIFLRIDVREFDYFDLKRYFIDEEKKVAAFLGLNRLDEADPCGYRMANIIGEDGYLRSFKMDEVYWRARDGVVFVCSSYVPSLVQLQINQPDKTEEINQPDETKEKVNHSEETKEQTNR
ncbi:unnamed protein product [Microthlaspi erraticum]|uniref:F-box domain-containing protein n=1 Tax=Microthlaspi erraticum TaxID=1685480 RepID=A0A6D2J1Q2_9BRAS|nr:unnamed protein product [Microthlaspi erraticum]